MSDDFRIPDAFAAAYRPLRDAGTSGWIDRTLHDALPGPLRAVPWQIVLAPGAVVVRDKRNLTVRLDAGSAMAFDTLWIKRFSRSGLSTPARKAAKAWNAAMALRAYGITTPRPLLGVRRGRNVALVAFEHFEGGESLAELAGAQPRGDCDLDAILHALGRHLRHFHERGFQHRDLGSGNLLVRAPAGADPVIALLDINRIRRYQHLNHRQRVRDLERIRLPAPLLLAMCRGYCAEEGQAQRLAREIGSRQRRHDALAALPHPLGRAAGKLWYYSRELTTLRRQCDLLHGIDARSCAPQTRHSLH